MAPSTAGWYAPRQAAAGAASSPARTANFAVSGGGGPDVDGSLARLAEHWRKVQAVAWLGRELPAWRDPCPVRVTWRPKGGGGATSFAFDPQGRPGVLGQRMHVEFSADMASSVLAHEVTHTVFAWHFGKPVPRWADEGAAVLSESADEQARHAQLAAGYSRDGRLPKLRALMDARDYPADVMGLYAGGYAAVRLLVEEKGKPAFLAFLGDGMRRGWDPALRDAYGYASAEALESEWVAYCRLGCRRRQAPGGRPTLPTLPPQPAPKELPPLGPDPGGVTPPPAPPAAGANGRDGVDGKPGANGRDGRDADGSRLAALEAEITRRLDARDAEAKRRLDAKELEITRLLEGRDVQIKELERRLADSDGRAAKLEKTLNGFKGVVHIRAVPVTQK